MNKMLSSFASWLRDQRIPYAADAAIAPHLYFRIGGTVSLLVSPPAAEPMTRVLAKLSGEKLPAVVIGGGSNIVFGDGPTRAAVVLAPSPPVPARRLADGSLQAEGGARNGPFLAWCAAHGAAGLEFLSGIPGTLGGAAAVNAGAFGRSMSDVLLGADIVDETGSVRPVAADHFAFRYRDSRFKLGRETIVALRLRFEAGSEAAIARKSRENLEYRLRRHPSYGVASAGCFFKNPLVDGVKTSAGKIIEECGLKQAACGDLAVAQEHANFLLNRGRGTFADLQRLEEMIRAGVAARTGIELAREVIYVSPDGEKY